MADGSERQSRYPGVRPFADDDLQRGLFHGRDAEKYELLQLVLAERLVVVFSRSGMGKSSLVNAGLLSPLREQGHFPMVVRVGGEGEVPSDALYNGVSRELARQADAVEAHPDQADWNRASLWHFFKSLEIWRGAQLLSPVLIIDQFEELFTLHRPEVREDFIRDLAGLVRGVRPRRVEARPGESFSETPPDVKVVLVLREEFYPNLEELRDAIPGIYRAPFRLSPLSADSAREAITIPAEAAGDVYLTPAFTWDESALSLVLGFLSGTRGGEARSGASSDIEPFQLQLVCQYAEDLVHEKGLKAITAADLGGEQALKSVIGDFYETSLRKVREAFPDRPDLPAKLEKLCEEGLIIAETGRRRLLEESDIKAKFGIDRDVLRKMLDLRLIREEPRVGDSYYELAHDTLVEPIRRDRKRREAREAQERQERDLADRLTAARRRMRRRVAIAALVLFGLIGAGIYWQNQNRLVALAAAEAERAELAAARAEAAEEKLAKLEAEEARKAAEEERAKAEAERAAAEAERQAAEQQRAAAQADAERAEQAKAEAEAQLQKQREREAAIASARDVIQQLRTNALGKIGDAYAKAREQASVVSVEVAEARNLMDVLSRDLDAARGQLKDLGDTLTAEERRDAEANVVRIEAGLALVERRLAFLTRTEKSRRTATAAIDRTHDDLAITLDAVLEDMSDPKLSLDPDLDTSVWIGQSEAAVDAALDQVKAIGMEQTGPVRSTTVSAQSAATPAQDVSPAAQAKFEMAELELLEEDAEVLDRDLAAAFRALTKTYGEVLTPALRAEAEDKARLYAASAEAFAGLTSGLYICEELDRLPIYQPPRDLGPERAYVTRRMAELAALKEETAVVVMAANMINTNGRNGEREVQRVRVGQQAHFRAWVTSPGRVAMDLTLQTPDGPRKIWGAGARSINVSANPLAGRHLGYRLWHPETIRRGSTPGDYEWQLRDGEGRKLCRARFTVVE